MIKEKKAISTKVNTIDKGTYIMYMHSKLKKSRNDIANGRVMSIEESKERMRKKYESFDVK